MYRLHSSVELAVAALETTLNAASDAKHRKTDAKRRNVSGATVVTINTRYLR